MSLEDNLDKILIIDFGSQFTQLIARRVREFGVYSQIISHKKINNQLLYFDKYLKSFHYNPGTCADLTVTTLLISKIRDIFKFQI